MLTVAAVCGEGSGVRSYGSAARRLPSPRPLNKPLLTRVSLHCRVTTVPISLLFNSSFQNDTGGGWNGNVSGYIALEEIVCRILLAHQARMKGWTLKCLFSSVSIL